MRLLRFLQERREVRFEGWADLLYSAFIVGVVALALYAVGEVGR